jgi:DNA mismatch endonuclease (patch repair protein)
MVDNVSSERRSHIMSKVRSRNTSPELRVRKAAHALGLRFRLHRKDLPGKPDLVFPKLKTAVFVNGCFWHQHSGCRRAQTPKTRPEFWDNKFRNNITRDAQNTAALEQAGWKVVVIWECETKTEDSILQAIHRVVEV